MRAICLTAPRIVAVLEVPEPALGVGQLQVAVQAVGLCGSDLTVYDGDKAVPGLPWVLGHEGAGVVTAVGEGVETDLVGRTVVLEPNLPCRDCRSCREGKTSLCPARRSLGMNVPGALAERVVVPASAAWPVEGWTPQQLVTLEPLAVAVAAVRRSGLVSHQRAAVVGAGSLGLQACVALRAGGHDPAVVDLDPGRVRTALGAGARRHQEGDSYDVVFETAGAPAAVTTALQLVRSGGTVVLTGLSPRPTELFPADLVRRGVTLVGSIIYDHPEDFRAAIALAEHPVVVAAAGRLGPGARPADAASAFEQARVRPMKTWVDCTRWDG